MASVLSKLDRNANGEFIVAKRKRGIGAVFLFGIIAGADLIVSGLVCLLFGVLDFEVAIMAVIGIPMLILGIVNSAKYFSLPKYAITYKDGAFRLPKKTTCKPSEFGDISIKKTQNLVIVQIYAGTLYYSVNGEKRVMHYLADIEQVEADIVQIKREYTQSLYGEKIKQSQSAQPIKKEEVKPPEEVIPTAQPEQPVQAAQPEQPEQTEIEKRTEKSEQLTEAENIKLPDLPDLPDIN
ncbi:MAG: hypothetical protein K2G38_06860 [Clostridia bacterium]|nr:hypothetical protein [Clostridia bacterium]